MQYGLVQSMLGLLPSLIWASLSGLHDPSMSRKKSAVHLLSFSGSESLLEGS